MGINVIKVETKAQRREFVKFPLELYRDNPYFVPPLYADEMAMFTNKNAYAGTCESVFFLAERDGKTVGRIQGIIQHQHNELHAEKRIRFTRFDAINDTDVAKALFDALEKFGAEQGLDTVCGPLGYSDLEREGLLIEGFDKLSTFEEQYNFEYYSSLIEACGYEKEIDWLEFMLRAPKNKNIMLERVAERALELSKLHVVDSNTMSKKEYIDRYKDGVFECIDLCYRHLYGTVPFTEEMKKQNTEVFSDVPVVAFGPFEAPVYRVDNVYRMRMVVKCRLNRRARAMFAAILRAFTADSRGTHKPVLSVDFNPSSI